MALVDQRYAPGTPCVDADADTGLEESVFVELACPNVGFAIDSDSMSDLTPDSSPY